ncbi:ornithine cyclodeaminase family protein [Streptomyces sp. NPDC002742]|uniref:ornithine cyclodeaminase family protein n=1 Tax=Streptomyces sp. NPDC002742 TaxID=3364663 RepID=UPI0036898A41
MLRFTEYPDEELPYLSRRDVITCCEAIDVCAVVEDALRQHASGASILPDEACLRWQTAEGMAARSLGMPGAVTVEERMRYGIKIINGSLANPAKGIARSQGFLMLFDPETAWPDLLMESAYVSAMRTAAVTMISARYLGNGPARNVALLGCGTLARAHLTLLLKEPHVLESVRLFDTAPERAAALARELKHASSDLTVVEATGPEDCVRGADLVVPVTTVTAGYLKPEWFARGALITHVSLDDVLPDVVRAAGLVVVDDWNLVSHDRTRLLGRMYGQGALRGPAGEYSDSEERDLSAPLVHTSLGEVVAGSHPGRTAPGDLVLCNPFGMAILDVALGSAVADAARDKGLGQLIQR